ncbi:MAG: CD225/dispanin family protein [Planctomycetota bacterium]
MKCPICNAENTPGTDACSFCGTALKPAAAAHADDDFELQPVVEKPNARENQQGPPRIDLDAEAVGHDVPPKKGEKKKSDKPAPERPKDYKKEAKILMASMGALLLVPIFFCLFSIPDFCGRGFPNILGLIAGALAMLESLKVDEFYKAGDYEGAEKASVDAQRWIKIGVIAALVSLVLLGVIQVIWYVVSKMQTVVAPKTDI